MKEQDKYYQNYLQKQKKIFFTLVLNAVIDWVEGKIP